MRQIRTARGGREPARSARGRPPPGLPAPPGRQIHQGRGREEGARRIYTGEELLLPDLLPELMTMRAAAVVEVVALDPLSRKVQELLLHGSACP